MIGEMKMIKSVQPHLRTWDFQLWSIKKNIPLTVDNDVGIVMALGALALRVILKMRVHAGRLLSSYFIAKLVFIFRRSMFINKR